MNDNIPPGSTPPTAPAMLPATGLVRHSRVFEFIPISSSSFYASQAKGLYPHPVAMGPRARTYHAEDVSALIEKGVA
ncbi:hypothetical protein [Methylobacterium sp. WL116]|uniref:helix-turn-helix transcriptional regulator n=1 Tax=Methylobacterium sp. WL116 TaxID=2603889 RepID=UPI0011CBDCF2|nr:hypothetical protein [Methylobacterium sp. WL116]TXM92615.1 hypothetical protein FV223_11230 [Methylobacterium sp. WL116]